MKLTSSLHIFFVSILLFFSHALFSLTLAEKFSNAAIGDYVVFSQDKQLFLLRVSDKTKSEIALEEICMPDAYAPQPFHADVWLQNNAPHHTSWVIQRFNLQTGELLSSYSFATNEYLTKDPLFSFLPTLLKLPLQEVSKDLRKKVGPEPLPDEPDTRKLWQPKIIFEGKELPTQCSVYFVRWKNDDSELSGKSIQLYFPEDPASLTYFPYWVEIVGNIYKVKVRVLNSGKNLESPASEPVNK